MKNKRITVIKWLSEHKEFNYSYKQADTFISFHKSRLETNGANKIGRTLYLNNEEQLTHYLKLRTVLVKHWMIENIELKFVSTKAANFIRRRKELLKNNGAVEVGNRLYVKNEEQLLNFIKSISK